MVKIHRAVKSNTSQILVVWISIQVVWKDEESPPMKEKIVCLRRNKRKRVFIVG